MKVVMVSTFGPEIRGVSPYSDSLLSYININQKEVLKPINFSLLYPKFLSPVDTQSNILGDNLISAFNIKTWKDVFLSKFDVIHLQYWTFLTLPCYLYLAWRSKKKGLKCLLTIHNPNPHEKIPFLSFLEKRLYRLMTKIIVHTESGKEMIIKRFAIDEDKIEIIPLGIEFDSVTPSSSSSKKQILFFGNIRSYKGVGDLLDAWNMIRDRFPDFNLIIAGRLWGGKTWSQKLVGFFLGASKEAKNIEYWKSLGIEQIKFDIGFIDDDVLNSYIEESSFGVFPYKWFDSQSAAAARACGMGMPVVVSDVGGLPELAIDERFIFPAGDVNKLAETLVAVIHVINSEEWASIKKTQISITNKFSIELVAQKHVQLYSRLSHV